MNTLSKNTNLRSTVQVYHFFLGSIDFQCMFSLVFTVYCQKQPPEQRCTAHTSLCYLSVLLYVQHLLPHHHCYYSEAVVRRCAIKKGVLRNFGKFTGKHLWRSLFFNKVVGLRPATLFKKRLWHKCFPMSFAKFLRTPFVTEDF